MFVIDRRNKNKIYYVNSQKFRFHKDFLLANYLVPRGDDVFKPIYIDRNAPLYRRHDRVAKAGRKIYVGTVGRRPRDRRTYQDSLTKRSIRHFFKRFLTNRTRFGRKTFRQILDIDRVSQDDINKNQEYLALKHGRSRRAHSHYRQARRHGRNRRQRDSGFKGTAAELCRRFAALSSPNLRRRFRTSIFWQKAGKFRMFISRTPISFSKNTTRTVLSLNATLTDYKLNRRVPKI